MKYPIAIGICHDSHVEASAGINVLLSPFSELNDKQNFYKIMHEEGFISFSVKDELICNFYEHLFRLSPLIVGKKVVIENSAILLSKDKIR